MERESFVFYRSFYEAIKDLPRDVQSEIYTAIMEYGLYGRETEQLKPIARSIFMLVKPQIDANFKRFKNGCNGGRPTKKETEQKPNVNQKETEQKPNDNDNDNIPPYPNGYVSPQNGKDKKSENLEKLEKRKQAFYSLCAEHVSTYGKNMIRKFFDYWTEPNKSKTKMRFELERTWDLSRRLSTWDNNNGKFGNQKNGEQKDNNVTV